MRFNLNEFFIVILASYHMVGAHAAIKGTGPLVSKSVEETKNQGKTVQKNNIIEDKVQKKQAGVKSTNLIEDPSAAQKKWGLAITVDNTTDLQKASAEQKILISTLGLSASFKLPYGLSSFMSFSGSKNMTNGRQQSFNDGAVGIKRALFSYKNLSSGASLKVILPINKDNREQTSFRTRLGLAPNLVIGLRPIGLKETNIIFSTSLNEYFHEYKRTAYNTENTQFSVSNAVTISQDFKEKYNFAIYFSNNNGWTYSGFRKPSTYAFGQSLSTSFGKGWSASLAHNVGGGVYDYNGRDLKIKAFDPDASTISLSVTFGI